MVISTYYNGRYLYFSNDCADIECKLNSLNFSITIALWITQIWGKQLLSRQI